MDPAVNPVDIHIDVAVHVVNCSMGDVTARAGDACQTCDWGWYSLDPRNSTCDQCLPNAVCKGGASIAPLPGWWHSSPRSIQVHRCASRNVLEGAWLQLAERGSALHSGSPFLLLAFHTIMVAVQTSATSRAQWHYGHTRVKLALALPLLVTVCDCIVAGA